VIRLLDHYVPWLVELLELGGPILAIILLMATGIWALLFERVYFLVLAYPRALSRALDDWRQRRDRSSWFAQQHRNDLVVSLGSSLVERYPLISTLIKICPLLGLLGTVIGMLEVFDALAATGSNNPRSMAAGVSKATVSTLAGMVVAIVGLLGNTLAERRALAEKGRLASYFESTGGSGDA